MLLLRRENPHSVISIVLIPRNGERQNRAKTAIRSQLPLSSLFLGGVWTILYFRNTVIYDHRGKLFGLHLSSHRVARPGAVLSDYSQQNNHKPSYEHKASSWEDQSLSVLSCQAFYFTLKKPKTKNQKSKTKKQCMFILYNLKSIEVLRRNEKFHSMLP